MKATIEFELPDEQEEYFEMLRATKLSRDAMDAFREIMEICRQKYKYEDDEKYHEFSEIVRNTLKKRSLDDLLW